MSNKFSQPVNILDLRKYQSNQVQQKDYFGHLGQPSSQQFYVEQFDAKDKQKEIDLNMTKVADTQNQKNNGIDHQINRIDIDQQMDSKMKQKYSVIESQVRDNKKDSSANNGGQNIGQDQGQR